MSNYLKKSLFLGYFLILMTPYMNSISKAMDTNDYDGSTTRTRTCQECEEKAKEFWKNSKSLTVRLELTGKSDDYTPSGGWVNFSPGFSFTRYGSYYTYEHPEKCFSCGVNSKFINVKESISKFFNNKVKKSFWESDFGELIIAGNYPELSKYSDLNLTKRELAKARAKEFGWEYDFAEGCSWERDEKWGPQQGLFWKWIGWY